MASVSLESTLCASVRMVRVAGERRTSSFRRRLYLEWERSVWNLGSEEGAEKMGEIGWTGLTAKRGRGLVCEASEEVDERREREGESAGEVKLTEMGP